MANKNLTRINNSFQTFDSGRGSALGQGAPPFILSTYQFDQMTSLIRGGGHQYSPQSENPVDHVEPAFGEHIREAARGLRRLFHGR